MEETKLKKTFWLVQCMMQVGISFGLYNPAFMTFPREHLADRTCSEHWVEHTTIYRVDLQDQSKTFKR